jgi:hypothetical protein
MTYQSAIVGACAWALVASAATVSAQSPKKLESVDTPNVHGFSVTLVLGDMQGASTPDNLPPGAKKALADMRDFLPYKSYRLLDTQWILCCGSSKVGTGVSGRLRGVNQVESSSMPLPVPLYFFSVTVLGVSGPQLSVRFVLTDGTDPRNEDAREKVIAQRQQQEAQRQQQVLAEAMLADARKQLSPEHPDVKALELQLNEIVKGRALLSRAPSGGEKGAVIDSTFSMNVGETVVIGTSSLKGEKALIALLTAVRRPGPQSETMQGEKR